MFGCIGRVVVVAVLVIAFVAAYLTRGWWEPKVRDAIGVRPAAHGVVSAWEPVTAEGAARARAAIAGMKRPTGPAFVNVKAGDLVAFVLDSLLRGWGGATGGSTGAEALAGENTVSLRGTIHMKDLGSVGSLGPLAGVLEGDQQIEVRGRLEVVSQGHAQYKVERVSLKNLVLPSAAIGPLVQRLAPRTDPSLDRTAIAVTLPPDVADIRVTAGRITLYKAVK